MVIKVHVYYGHMKNGLVAVSFEPSKCNVQYYIVSMQIIKNLRPRCLQSVVIMPLASVIQKKAKDTE